jgi:hypothetical protein
MAAHKRTLLAKQQHRLCIRAKMRSSRHRALALIVVVLLASAVFGGRALRSALLPIPLDRCASREFHPRLWSDTIQAHSPTAPRGCMVDDLLRRHSLLGATRSEVEELLGKPTTTSYFRDYDLVHYLGPERSFLGIDSEWLVLRLDGAGRVSERRIVTD